MLKVAGAQAFRSVAARLARRGGARNICGAQGVLSGAGDCKPGIILSTLPSEGTQPPLALVGKVYCKVDAQYAPIAVGDLLTTSGTPGHAMKATATNRCHGAILGKALHEFAHGQGLIPVLLAMQ
jgi:hypothetical protein